MRYKESNHVREAKRRNYTGWTRRRGRHPFDKRRPFPDERYRDIQSVLQLVFSYEEAQKLTADYQYDTRKRGHIYALSLAKANTMFKRGPERAALRKLITMAHHACFNKTPI